jgi:hypothetical protein
MGELPETIQKRTRSVGGTAIMRVLNVGNIKGSTSEKGRKTTIIKVMPINIQTPSPRFAKGTVSKITAGGQQKPTQRITLRVLLTHGLSGRTLMDHHLLGQY